MRRRRTLRSTLIPVLIVAGLAALMYVIATTVSFINTRNLLPRGTTLASADVSGLTTTEAISKTARALQGPVFLRYQSQNITLLPSEVDFSLDETAVQAQLDEVIADNSGFDKLPQLLLRQPITGSPVSVLPQFYCQAGCVSRQPLEDLRQTPASGCTKPRLATGCYAAAWVGAQRH